MNTPRTDKVCELLIGAPLNGHPLADLSRQLETQVQELREALEAIAVQPMSNDWSRQVARAILEKTK